MRKSRFVLTSLTLLSRLGRAACQKENTPSDISRPSTGGGEVPAVSQNHPSTTPSEKPTGNRPSENPSSSKESSSGKPSSSVSAEEESLIDKALKADYSNVTATSIATSDDVGDTTDTIFYYNDYQIVEANYGGDTLRNFYHDYKGESYQWFEATNGKGKSGWLNKGYGGAYVGRGGRANLDFRNLIKKIGQYKQNIITQGNTYYITNADAIEDIVDTNYAWCYDVSINAFFFTIDATSKTFKTFGAYNTSIDTETNSAVCTLTSLGTTTYDNSKLPAAPNESNIEEYWQYKGFSGPQVKVYVKSVDLKVKNTEQPRNGTFYARELESFREVEKTVTYDIPEGIEEDRIIYDTNPINYVSEDDTIASLDFFPNYGFGVRAQDSGDTKVYATFTGSDGKIHKSNVLDIHVNSVPAQNLKDAVYNLSFTGIALGNIVGANNAISNSLPYIITINKGCSVGAGQSMFLNENVLTLRSGNQDTRSEDDTKCDAVATFDFSDQQVSGISFYYGQRYSVNELSGLEKIVIETSNDKGTTWREAKDITDEITSNISLKNPKLLETSFAPAYRVRIHVYGNRIGKSYGFSTDKVAFIADENCHKHGQVDETPVESLTIAAYDNAQSVKIGQTLKFNLSVLPNNATNKDVTWHVSDPSLASIGEDGILTPIAKGNVSVYATSDHGEGKTLVTSNTVTIEIKDADKVASNLIGAWTDKDENTVITVSDTQAVITFGNYAGTKDSITLPYTGKDEYSYDVFGTYVNNSTPGYLKIKKSSRYNNKADFVLNVVGANGLKKEINVHSSQDTLDRYIKATDREIDVDGDGNAHVGKTSTVSASFSDGYDDAESEKWKLTSADETIVSVKGSQNTYGKESERTLDEKKIQGIKLGKTTLTAESETGLTATLSIEVTKITADDIKLTIKDPVILVGGTTKATYKITPVDTENQNVSFTSSNTSVATISEDGTITGLKAGTSTIRVTCLDGSKIYDEAEITVRDAPSKSDISYYAGEWKDDNGYVYVTIGVDGSVTVTDYTMGISDEELDYQFDGTILTAEVYGESITITFHSDGTATYEAMEMEYELTKFA